MPRGFLGYVVRGRRTRTAGRWLKWQIRQGNTKRASRLNLFLIQVIAINLNVKLSISCYDEQLN